MSKPVIAVTNLSKRYLIEHSPGAHGHKRYTAMRDVITDQVRNFAHRTLGAVRGRPMFSTRDIEEFWALKNTRR